MGTLHVVVGGQYGSEGKGHVAHRLVRESRNRGDISQVWSVRVGGPNAGHTVYDDDGNRFPFRTIPVGAITPGVTCLIAAGSEIDLDVLADELALLKRHGHRPQILIHDEATVLTADHRRDESLGWNASTHGSPAVASTQKGIGAARADRIWRQARRIVDLEDAADAQLNRLLDQYGYSQDGPVLRTLSDPDSILLNDVYRDPHSAVVLEGTQGYGLGLHAGHYPKTTSGDCRAIDFLAQAGISPWFASGLGLRIWVVIRPNPIRIAGDSGPMRDETTWEALGLEPELTTVTQKVRRVGAWDPRLVARAVRANGGPSSRVRLALTMADHLVPEVAGLDTNRLTVDPQSGRIPGYSKLEEEIRRIEQSVADELGAITPESPPAPQLSRARRTRFPSLQIARVALVTTGPNTAVWR